MKPSDYEAKIKKLKIADLRMLWKEILANNTAKLGWDPGMAFQYLIIRAFEIEKNQVTYPYSVKIPGTLSDLQQIDGVIYLKGSTLSILVESKNLNKNIDFTPISLLQSQLNQRPNSTIAAIFTTKGLTPASFHNHSLIQGNTILVWEYGDIEICLKKGKFTEGMKAKYKYAIEHGIKTYDLQTHFK